MPTRETDLVAKVLMAMTGCMVLLVAMFAYMVFASVAPPPSIPDGRGDPPSIAIACDLSRPDAAECPDDSYCVRGTCEPLDDEDRVCGEGESCRACTCAGDLVCHQLRCHPPADVVVAPLDCRSKPVADAVQQLRSKCEASGGAFAQLRSLTSCSADDWNRIALDNADFDVLLSNFDNRFSVHFPNSEPRERGARLDDRHLLTRIGRLREPLRQARQIFVIGRSSPDGDEQENYRLALRRIDTVSGLIERVVHGDTPRSQQTPLPIRQWGLRSDRQARTGPDAPAPRDPLFRPKYFRKHYVSQAVRERFGIAPTIADSEATERRIVELLAHDAAAERQAAAGQPVTRPLTRPERDWLIGALNRVVIVVPIPCDGSEYVPPAAIVPVSIAEAAR